MMKNSAVKTNIFEKVQKMYSLMSLKLVKAVVTRSLSHGKAYEQVLNRFELLVLVSDEIYERTGCSRCFRPVTGIISVAMLYLMADNLTYTNTIQTILLVSVLNFLEIPAAVSKLVEDLEQKAIDPTKPTTCYFAKLDGFKLSAGTQFHL